MRQEFDARLFLGLLVRGDRGVGLNIDPETVRAVLSQQRNGGVELLLLLIVRGNDRLHPPRHRLPIREIALIGRERGGRLRSGSGRGR